MAINNFIDFQEFYNCMFDYSTFVYNQTNFIKVKGLYSSSYKYNTFGYLSK